MIGIEQVLDARGDAVAFCPVKIHMDPGIKHISVSVALPAKTRDVRVLGAYILESDIGSKPGTGCRVGERALILTPRPVRDLLIRVGGRLFTVSVAKAESQVVSQIPS